MERTFKLVKETALKYPNLEFVIENVTARFQHPFDNIEFAKMINLPNIGTVLDICHMYITLTLLNRLAEPYRYPTFTHEDVFRNYQDTIKHVHLNNAIDVGEGYGRGEGHGVPFLADSKSDMVLLDEFFELYKKYANGATITIEVREDDYIRNPNLDKTLKSVKMSGV